MQREKVIGRPNQYFDIGMVGRKTGWRPLDLDRTGDDLDEIDQYFDTPQPKEKDDRSHFPPPDNHNTPTHNPASPNGSTTGSIKELGPKTLRTPVYFQNQRHPDGFVRPSPVYSEPRPVIYCERPVGAPWPQSVNPIRGSDPRGMPEPRIHPYAHRQSFREPVFVQYEGPFHGQYMPHPSERHFHRRYSPYSRLPREDPYFQTQEPDYGPNRIRSMSESPKNTASPSNKLIPYPNSQVSKAILFRDEDLELENQTVIDENEKSENSSENTSKDHNELNVNNPVNEPDMNESAVKETNKKPRESIRKRLGMISKPSRKLSAVWDKTQESPIQKTTKRTPSSKTDKNSKTKVSTDVWDLPEEKSIQKFTPKAPKLKSTRTPKSSLSKLSTDLSPSPKDSINNNDEEKGAIEDDVVSDSEEESIDLSLQKAKVSELVDYSSVPKTSESNVQNSNEDIEEMIEDLLDGSEPHSGLQPAAKDVSVHGSDASEVESNQVSGETVVSNLENESVNNESVINTNTIEEGENLNNPHDKNDKCEPENTDQKKRGLPIHRTPLKSTPISQKHIPTKTIKTPLTITKANSTGKGVAEQTDTVPQQKSSPKKSQSNTNGNTKSKPHSKKSRIVLSDEEKSESGDSNHSHHELGYIPDDVATEDEDGSGQSLERTTSAEDTEATVINRKRGRLPKKSKGTVSRLNYTKKTSVVQKEVIRHTGGDSDEEGVRRSKRMKIEPLAYWKNEKAIYGPEETEIIRVLTDEESIPTKHQSRPKQKSNKSRPKKSPAVPQEINVLNYLTREEEKQRIAVTEEMIRIPRDKGDTSYRFQKVFSEGDFLASGILEIPRGSMKPMKNSSSSAMIFYLICGESEIQVNKTTFKIQAGGQFMVPRGNQYRITNIGQEECRLFFCHGKEIFK